MTTGKKQREFTTVEEVLDYYFDDFKSKPVDDEEPNPKEAGKELVDNIVGSMKISIPESKPKKAA